MDNINQAWGYIDRWLIDEAKDCQDALFGGATEDELEKFQSDLDATLPADFFASYLIHDGFKEKIGLIHGADLLSLSEIKENYNRLLLDKSLKNWGRDMLPVIMYNDYAYICINFKDHLIYDLVIDENGVVSSDKLHFDSFSHIITSVAQDLKEGNGCMGELLC